MAIFRVEKTKDYTVMSNHHLRNVELSLKAKGLLSLMLSLPETWNYTTKGLASICKDGQDSICAGIKELEKHGYLTRRRIRNARGQLTEIEYTVHENPVMSESLDLSPSEPKRENPVLDNPILENPEQDYPKQGFPRQENHAQSSIDILNKKILNTELSNIHQSIHLTEAEADAKQPSPKHTTSAFDAYREIICDNIEYDILAKQYGAERMDEIVELLLETVCSNRKYIRIAGADFPAEVVKSRLLKLDSSHIEYCFDCLDKNNTKIHNIKSYLLTALYNAPVTIDNFYRAEVRYDFYGKSLEA